jgi:hypothetical protein
MKPMYRTAPIAVTRADGGVSILNIITHFIRQPMAEDVPVIDLEDGAVPERIVREELEKAFRPGEVVSWRQIRAEDIPSAHYRDAWIDTGSAITHDMGKARAMLLADLRTSRIEQLDALDRDWMRATGRGQAAEAARVESERQRLRDLPATLNEQIEAATTVDQLRAIGLRAVNPLSVDRSSDE